MRLNPMRLSQPDSSTKTYCHERICDVLYRYKSRRSAFRPFAIQRIVFLVQPMEASALPML